MTDDSKAMTLILKALIHKAAAHIVLNEVLLGIFNSYDYQEGESEEVEIESDELAVVHRLFEIEYRNALKSFLDTDEAERDQILDAYIEGLADRFASK